LSEIFPSKTWTEYRFFDRFSQIFSYFLSEYFFAFAIAPWPGALSIFVCYQVLKNDHHDLWLGKLGDLIAGTKDKHTRRTRKKVEVASVLSRFLIWP